MWFLRVCLFCVCDEVCVFVEGVVCEVVEVDVWDIDVKCVVMFEFVCVEDVMVVFECLCGGCMCVFVFGVGVVDGEMVFVCGYSVWVSDSRASERERTKALRRLFVEGLMLIENFVMVDEERVLVMFVVMLGDEMWLVWCWVKYFGYAFDYGTRDANLKVVDEIFELVMEVLWRFLCEMFGYEGVMWCD